MDPIPDVITHNFDPARGALHNICELSERQAELVLDDIRASGTRKANYLQRRRAVENWLIAECRRKLGPTHLQRPRYFFLGNFADGRDRSRPESLVMPLAAASWDWTIYLSDFRKVAPDKLRTILRQPAAPAGI